MAAKVKWRRSSDGFCDSACGRYKITPLYCGCVKPQMFDLWFYPNGLGGERKKIDGMASSQRECKDAANRHHEGLYP